MTPLQGRTVALAGLDAETLLAASSAAEGAGGDWQAFGRTPELPKLRAFRREAQTAHEFVPAPLRVQQEADVVKGFRLGVDDYVIKPFNPMELLARIKRLVRRD